MSSYVCATLCYRYLTQEKQLRLEEDKFNQVTCVPINQSDGHEAKLFPESFSRRMLLKFCRLLPREVKLLYCRSNLLM